MNYRYDDKSNLMGTIQDLTDERVMGKTNIDNLSPKDS